VSNLKRNQLRFINKADQIKIMGQYTMNPIISSIGLSNRISSSFCDNWYISGISEIKQISFL